MVIMTIIVTMMMMMMMMMMIINKSNNNNNKNHNNCSSNNNSCKDNNNNGDQYTGCTKTKFRSRANNYKSAHRDFISKKEVPKHALKQKRLHDHDCMESHTGIEDWVITLIDSTDTLKELRKKELYLMYKLKTYAPYGLNEREIYEAS